MKKNIKFLAVFFTIFFSLLSLSYAAGTSSGGNGYDQEGLYKQGKKLVLRAKKQEKKNKIEKAQELYLKAYNKFEKAYAKNKKSADILNYLGYTLRKTGNFEKAELYYLKGLKLDAGHIGINEYLGELYVETNRIELAKERLNVLQGCKCEEYEELKYLIKNN